MGFNSGFKGLKRFVQCHVSSPSHRQTGALVRNIQSTLRNATELCKNVSLAGLFSSNGNSYTISTQSHICIYRHSSQYRGVSWVKEI